MPQKLGASISSAIDKNGNAGEQAQPWQQPRQQQGWLEPEAPPPEVWQQEVHDAGSAAGQAEWQQQPEPACPEELEGSEQDWLQAASAASPQPWHTGHPAAGWQDGESSDWAQPGAEQPDLRPELFNAADPWSAEAGSATSEPVAPPPSQPSSEVPATQPAQPHAAHPSPRDECGPVQQPLEQAEEVQQQPAEPDCSLPASGWWSVEQVHDLPHESIGSASFEAAAPDSPQSQQSPQWRRGAVQPVRVSAAALPRRTPESGSSMHTSGADSTAAESTAAAGAASELTWPAHPPLEHQQAAMPAHLPAEVQALQRMDVQDGADEPPPLPPLDSLDLDSPAMLAAAATAGFTSYQLHAPLSPLAEDVAAFEALQVCYPRWLAWARQGLRARQWSCCWACTICHGIYNLPPFCCLHRLHHSSIHSFSAVLPRRTLRAQQPHGRLRLPHTWLLHLTRPQSQPLRLGCTQRRERFPRRRPRWAATCPSAPARPPARLHLLNTQKDGLLQQCS